MPDEALVEMVLELNASQRAHELILGIVLADLARQQADPHKYLARVFELTSATLDQMPVNELADSIAGPLDAMTRAKIQALVKKVDEAIRRAG